MTNKSITLKRVLIYLFFAFIPPWIMQFIYITLLGCDTNTKYYQIITSLSMLFPAAANIITRLITKEGFHKSYLRVNLKGNVKYYILSLAVPACYAVLSAIITIIFYMPSGTFSQLVRDIDIIDIITIIIYLLTLSALCSLPALGEEFGWRGYLTPKLEQLTNTLPALLISGIIWGLWHAPLTVIGHNFGTDYKFYPYMGIVLMCIFCTFIGSFLTYLTKKTGSVYPAALAHAANNNTVATITVSILMYCEIYTDEMAQSNDLLQGFVTGMTPVILLGLITFVLIILNSRHKPNVSN